MAQGLAESVGEWLADTGRIPAGLDAARALPRIAAACALIHDIGNPPFGHAGELAIQDWTAQRRQSDPEFERLFAGLPEQMIRDFLSFEGNAQTVRLLSRLQILIDFHGINLTAATLSAACKYTASSVAVNEARHETRKPGFFYSEAEVVDLVRKETGTGAARHPITYLVEAADDIVYSTVDIEDGIRKEVLDYPTVRDALDPGRVGEFAGPVFAKVEEKLSRAELARAPRDHEIAPLFRTFAIVELVGAAIKVFQRRYDEIMDGDYHGELLVDSESPAREFVEGCKGLVKKHVYVSPEIIELELMGRKVIHDLMDVFWEGALDGTDRRLKSYADRSFHLLSENYRNVYARAVEEGLSEPYAKLQLVTDQVSGMTDTFACALHTRLRTWRC